MCSNIESKLSSISKYQVLHFWRTEKQKIIDYIFQCMSLMQQNWKQSRSKQIPSVRVPRNRAAKNISLCFPSSLLPLGITPVPKFISNHFQGLIEAFNCLAYIIKPCCKCNVCTLISDLQLGWRESFCSEPLQ